MIKLLTGELEPDKGSGDVWKHPNCRVGYIAQHAFHHIEHHLEKSANEYMRWRYEGGGDREEAVKVTSIATKEEIAAMAKPFTISFTDEETGLTSKAKFVVDRLTERRRENKKKHDVEYECEMKGTETRYWVLLETLIENGFQKVVQKVDERIAIRAANFQRPLTKKNVADGDVADLGLTGEDGVADREAGQVRDRVRQAIAALPDEIDRKSVV